MSEYVFFIAQCDVHIDSLNSVGPGDEDVNSKGGRNTTVSVKTSNPRPGNSNQEVIISVEYRVSEGSSDYTTLVGQEDVSLQIESGQKFIEFGAGFINAQYKEVFRGEHHGWFDVSHRPGIQGSIIQWCNIKFDGKGDDHRGNAQLKAHLGIPLVVEVEAKNPPTGGTTSDGTTTGSGMLTPTKVPGWLSYSDLAVSSNPALKAIVTSIEASPFKVTKKRAKRDMLR